MAIEEHIMDLLGNVGFKDQEFQALIQIHRSRISQ